MPQERRSSGRVQRLIAAARKRRDAVMRSLVIRGTELREGPRWIAKGSSVPVHGRPTSLGQQLNPASAQRPVMRPGGGPAMPIGSTSVYVKELFVASRSASAQRSVVLEVDGLHWAIEKNVVEATLVGGPA